MATKRVQQVIRNKPMKRKNTINPFFSTYYNDVILTPQTHSPIHTSLPYPHHKHEPSH